MLRFLSVRIWPHRGSISSSAGKNVLSWRPERANHPRRAVAVVAGARPLTSAGRARRLRRLSLFDTPRREVIAAGSVAQAAAGGHRRRACHQRPLASWRRLVDLHASTSIMLPIHRAPRPARPYARLGRARTGPRHSRRCSACVGARSSADRRARKNRRGRSPAFHSRDLSRRRSCKDADLAATGRCCQRPTSCSGSAPKPTTRSMKAPGGAPSLGKLEKLGYLARSTRLSLPRGARSVKSQLSLAFFLRSYAGAIDALRTPADVETVSPCSTG